MQDNARDEREVELRKKHAERLGCEVYQLPIRIERMIGFHATFGEDYDKEKIEGVLNVFEQFDIKNAKLFERHEDAFKDNEEHCCPPAARDEWISIYSELWISVHEILGEDDFKKEFDSTLEEAIEIGKFWASGSRG
ncbi:MAG: hypothetical protein M0P64_02430 [Candidatus Pacebacteria bacterium]|jgi:hypothetical protein|nr:hypothetical protein [Candidatus Paceibacterota bacterium]